MVLSGLASSLRRLISQVRQAALSSCSRGDGVGSQMEVPEEHEIAVQFSIRRSLTTLVPAVPHIGNRDRPAEEVTDRVSLGIPLSTSGIVRLGPIKRKLDELDVEAAESSGSAASQVRPRREVREGMADVIVPRSIGRVRGYVDSYNPVEAQFLDEESQLRKEEGNEANDSDAMWDDENARSRSSDGHPGDCDNTIAYDYEDEILQVVGDAIAFTGDDKDKFVNQEDTDYGGTLFGSAREGFRVPDPTTIQNSETERAGGLEAEVALTKEIGVAEQETCGLRAGELNGMDDVRIWPTEKEADFDAELCFIGTDSNSTQVLEASRNTTTTNNGPSALKSSSSSCHDDPLCHDNIGTSDGEASGKGCHPKLQFFVRTYMDVRTIVLHANASDTIESVHWQIFLKTGLPISVQRLVYFGKQLQYDQTLAECRVGNDATLYLVARMHSTSLPRSWQIVNELVATIRRTCTMGYQEGRLRFRLLQSHDSIKSGVKDFLKMPSKSVKMGMKVLSYSEHMQVFQLAGATSALVMLLLSPIESNRECAEDSIKLFLFPSEEWLPADIHCYCAPVILDFCKLLAKNAPSHDLYPMCRHALGCLLDTIGFAHGSQYFNDAKPEKIVGDFAPFVDELSELLSSKLQCTTRDLLLNERSVYQSLKERQIFHSADIKAGQDFTAFLIPLCKAMEVCKGIENSCSSSGVSKTEGMADVTNFTHARNIVHGVDEGTLNMGDCIEDTSSLVTAHVPGSQRWLLQVFQKLLQELNNCLAAITDVPAKQPGTSLVVVADEQPLAPLLVILKGLHAIAKLYDNAAGDLLTMLHSRRAALNVLIEQSRWQDDHFWLLEHKCLLDFISKRKLVLAMLPEPKDDHEDRQEIFVNRAQLLSDSVGALANASRDTLQKGISVEFIGEEATGPGVLREWFFLLCREIFNQQNALFLSCPSDCRRIHPNPASGVNSEHLKFFRVCGRIVALALMHRVQMDVVFSLTFLKQLAGLPVSWEDARDADPLLYDGCKKILQMDADVVDSDVLGLTFACDVEELGVYKTVELCQGGKDMSVNSKNRLTYVEYLVHQRFATSVAEQVKSFSQGFSDLFLNAKHEQFLRVLEAEEFNLMLSGNNRIVCLEDWKSHTEYHDYSSSDDQIIWFWQVVECMTMEQRRKLLFFSTSVSNLPAEGFAGLPSKFHIHKAYTDITWLPTVHTCFYQLLLPPYPSFDLMNTRLLAVTDGHVCEGFGCA